MTIFATQTGETQVNTNTAGFQGHSVAAQRRSAAGALLGTVTVYESRNLGGDGDRQIAMQMFDVAGAKVGEEVLVNAPRSGEEFYARVTTLPGGFFAIVWEGDDNAGRGAFVRVYKADGTAVGDPIIVTNGGYGGDTAVGYNDYSPSISAVDGGFVVSWHSAPGRVDDSGFGVWAQRYSLTTASGVTSVARVSQTGAAVAEGVYAPFLVNAQTYGTQAGALTTALAGGAVFYTWYGPDQSGDGVFGRVMAADGTFGPEFQINSGAGSNQYYADAVQLANGNVFVTWTSLGQDGNGWGVYARIVTTSGAYVTDEFRVNDFVVANQSNSDVVQSPRIERLDDGSVVIVYYSDTDQNTDVFARRYSATGIADGNSIYLNADRPGFQSAVEVVAIPNGFRAVFYDQEEVSQRDFGYSGTIVDPGRIVRVGGEDQVNTASRLDQENSDVATFADGSYVVTWASQTSLTAGDGNDWGLFGQRFDASGSPVGAEFALTVQTAGRQYYHNVAALSDPVTGKPNGRFAVAWHFGQDGSDTDTWLRIFNADGTAATADLSVSDLGGYDAYADLVSLTNGDILVRWHSYARGGNELDIWTQRFSAAGEKIGGQVRVTTVDAVNANDGNEGGGTILALAGGGYAISWEDRSGQDGDRYGVYAKIYDDAGVGGVSFRVNQYAPDSQHVPVMAQAANGNIMFVWTSNWQDTSYEGIYARVFDASGAALGDEIGFNLGANPRVGFTGDAQYGQFEPAVAALADGSFAITWSSDADNGFNSTDVYAARLSNTGALLNEAFLVNTLRNGSNERGSKIAATENGFVITWTEVNDAAASSDGDQRGIFRQEFAIDGVNAAATGERAERPSVALGTVAGTTGNLLVNGDFETGAYATTFDTSVVPQGWIKVGDGNPTAASYAMGALNDLNALDSQAIGGGNAYYAGGPNTAASTVRQTVSVASQASAIDTGRVFANFGGDFGGYLGDNDATVMSLRFVGAAGQTLGAAQTTPVYQDQRGGVTRLLERLSVVGVPVGTRSIEVDLVATRTNGQYLDGFADNLTLSLDTTAVGREDNAIAIPLAIATQDANPATPETLSVELRGIPVGATVSDGVRSFTARPHDTAVDITGWTRAALTVTPPTNREDDFTLQVVAIAREPGTKDTATTVFDVMVDVVPQVETLVRGAPATRANTTTANAQDDTQVAVGANGQTVVVWTSTGQDGSGTGIYFQRYDAAGAPAGAETRVNDSIPNNQYSPEVTYLSDGKFVVAWSRDNQNILLRVFNADGSPVTGDVAGNTDPNYYNVGDPTVAALAGGGFLLTWHSNKYAGADTSSNGVYAQRFDANGARVSRDGATAGADEFLVNTVTNGAQDEARVVATADGGWIVVYSGYDQAGDPIDGVFFQRFSAAGATLGEEIHVNTLVDSTQFQPAIAVLTGGRFVVTWSTYTNVDADDSGYGIAGRIFNADGTAASPEFLINTRFPGDQHQSSVTSLPDGGFVVAYQTNSGQSLYDIAIQRFDAEGDKVGLETVLFAPGDGYDYRPDIAYDGTGLTVAWYSDAGDGSSNVAMVRRVALPAETVAPATSADVVPVTIAYQQRQPDIATLSDGSYVVAWQTAPSAGTGDISGVSVRAQRYNVDGTQAGTEFTLNTNPAGIQAEVSIAALDGGGFVAVWHSETGDGSSYGVFGQRFANDGSKIGAEFRISEMTSGSQEFPEVTALHGAQAGGFAVAWSAYGNVYARAFGGDGVAISGDLRVDSFNARVGDGDGNEGGFFGGSEDRSLTLAGHAGGGFTVVFSDTYGDIESEATIGQRFAIGTGNVVTAVGGTNSDGSASPGNFLVNTFQYSSQYMPEIVDLVGGGFVVIWYSDNTSVAGQYGVLAQIYNADGTRRGGEVNLDGGLALGQYDPSATALADGGFAVVWRDESLSGYTNTDIAGGRYSSTGALVERFTVTAENFTQLMPVIAAQGDGFNVAWLSNSGADGFGPGGGPDSDGIFVRHFAVDFGAAAGAKVAQAPNLTLGPVAAGSEDSGIALQVQAALADGDGGSETLRLIVQGLPAGAILTDGTSAHRFVASKTQTWVDVSGWTLANLTVTPPADFNGSFTLDVRATAREATGDLAFDAGTIRVDVAPVDEVQPPFGVERQDNQHGGDSQWQPAVASQADGSYLVVWESRAQPGQPYVSIVGRMHAADGTPSAAEFVISRLGGNYAGNPDVKALAGGGYIVVFQSYDGSGEGAYFQRVGADGRLLAIDGSVTQAPAATRANATTAGDQLDVMVEPTAGGGWVMVWRSQGQDGDSGGIYLQRYAADGTKSGAEVQVNSVTAGDQKWPDVAVLDNGDVGVVWSGPTGVFARLVHPDGSMTAETLVGVGNLLPRIAALENGTLVVTGGEADVTAQRIAADGTLAGGLIRVNTYAAYNQQEADLVALPDGGFVVTWTSLYQDGSSWGVYGQRYTALGTPVGVEFRINRSVNGDQSSPAIAVQGDGSGLVVVFEGQDGSGYGTYDVRLPVPDQAAPPAIATKLGELQVNDPAAAVAASDQSFSSATKLADGTFVVAYHSQGQDGSGYGVYARHYTASGDDIPWADGAREQRLNDATGANQWFPELKQAGDGFVAIFRSDPGSWYQAVVRRFDGDGVAQTFTDASGAATTELTLTPGAGTDTFAPSVAVGNDGAIVAVFHSDRATGEGQDIYVQRVDASGQIAAGGNVLLNQNVGSTQDDAHIVALLDGSFVVVWRSEGNDGSSGGIYARRLDAGGAPAGAEFLVNTFTDGNQALPAVAALTNGGFVVTWSTATGYDGDADQSAIAGQRFRADGTRIGSEFQVNGIADSVQDQSFVVGTQDGGFLVAWQTANSADGSGYAVAGRRFDASGNPTEPYGNDFLINSTTTGDQYDPRVALLDRGFVVTWTSAEAGNTVRLQLFEGAGLEPPPYVVDPENGGATTLDKVFSTIQQALDAALADNVPGQTIQIRGGTYTEALTVAVDDLKIVNAPGESVVIRAPAGAAAITVGANLNLTIRGDLADRLTIEGAAGQAAVRYLGNNDGSEVSKATVVSAAGGKGLVFDAGTDGAKVTDSAFAGPDVITVLAGSQAFDILRNTFVSNGGYAISTAATLGTISGNVFDGVVAADEASLKLSAIGATVSFNRFIASVGAHVSDMANAYDEPRLITDNLFPDGWARVLGASTIHSRIAAAATDLTFGGTLAISGGAWTEAAATIAVDNVTVSAPGGVGGATGIALALGADVLSIKLQGGAPIAVTGNGLANIITGGTGGHTLDGGTGDDTLDVTIEGGNVDTLVGGSGRDTAVLRDASGDGYTLADVSGVATLSGSDGTARATLAGIEVAQVRLGHSSGLAVGALAGVSVDVTGSGGSNVVDATATGVTVRFRGLEGADRFTGGAGEDTIVYANAAGTDVLVNLSAADLVVGAATLAAGTARDEAGSVDTLAAIDVVETGAGNDTVRGGVAGETFRTGTGDDTLEGGGGDDSLYGGAGTNTLRGGAGNDAYYVESASDTITEAAGEGDADRVVTGLASYSIAAFANVEQIVASNDAAHAFTGNGGANRLVGGAGNDTLTGGAGNDVLVGGVGNDTLVGGTDMDTAEYAAATGPITLVATSATQLRATGEGTDTLTGVERIVGSAGADSLSGYDATFATSFGVGLTLEGGGGDDVLVGTAQADTLDGGSGFDIAVTTAAGPRTGDLQRVTGGWTLTAGAGPADTLRNVERIVYAGTDRVYGTADDRAFAIENGSVAIVVAADSGTATEAGGVGNAVAASSAVGNLLNNDLNLDQQASAGDVMRVTQIGWTSAAGPGTGSGTGTTAVASAGNTVIQGRYGALTVAASGAYTYTPDAAKSDLLTQGSLTSETFTYTASDGLGAAVSTTLTILLTGTNDAPVAVADTGTTGENSAATFDVVANDTDVDLASALTLATVSTAKGSVSIVDGKLRFDPGTAFDALSAGQSEVVAIGYTVRDQHSATASGTLSLTVTGVNDAPVAVTDVGSGFENSVLTLDVLANDTDKDAVRTFTLISATAPAGKGIASVVDNKLVFNPGTAFDRLAANASETVVVAYTMRDDQGATSTSGVTITLTGTNDTPVATADTATTDEDTPVVVNLVANDADVDDGAALVVDSVTMDPVLGTVSPTSTGVLFSPNGRWNFLGAGQSGTAVVTYVVRDQFGATSSSTLTVTVTGANDAPTAAADTAAAGENDVAIVNVLGNDSDPDRNAVLTLVSVSAPAGKGSVDVFENKLRFTPGTAFDHLAQGVTETVTLGYVMRDDRNATSTGSVTLTVTGANDAPVATAQPSAATGENTPVTITRQWGTDVDDGAAPTLVSATASKGSVTVANGAITFIPGAAFDALAPGATETATITYLLQDAQGATGTGTMDVVVTGANDAPVATQDNVAITENQAIAIDVLANDSDPEGGRLTLVSVTGPAGKGVAQIINGKVRFTPGTDFDRLAEGATETVTLSYVTRDPAGAEATGRVVVTVTGTNDAPVLVTDTATVTEDNNVSVLVLANDSDPDGRGLTLTSVVAPEGRGLASIVNNRLFFRTNGNFDRLAEGVSTNVVVRYDAVDALGATSTGSAIITVTGVNDAPRVRNNRLFATEDTALVVPTTKLTGNDGDLDFGDTFTLTAVQNAFGGTVTLADGNVTFTPDANFAGTGRFEYVITDSLGATAVGKVAVIVKAVDDLAVARPDAVATDAATAVTGDVLADNGAGADVDVDGPRLKVETVNGQAAAVGVQQTLASGARVTLSADGKFAYDPGGAFASLTAVSGAVNSTAVDTFTYGLRAGGTGVVSVTVRGLYDATDVARGSAGADTMTGTAFADVIVLASGGADTVDAGDGDDRLILGAALTAADRIDGGAGALDEVIVQGNYTGATAVVFDPATLVNVEALSILSGRDTRFGAPGTQVLSYDFTTADATVAAGATLTVAALGLQANEALTFNGSAETDGSFVFVGSRGGDVLTGGARDDIFVFGNGGFGAGDRIAGGAGNDAIGLQGNMVIAFGATQLSGIEQIVAVSASDPNNPVPGAAFSYDLTLADGNVAGALLVDGTTLAEGEMLAARGGAVVNGVLTLLGGGGGDTLEGGAKADRIEGGAGADTIRGGGGGDTIVGGAGADVIGFGPASDSTSITYDAVTGFDFAADRFDVAGVAGDYHRDASTNANLSTLGFDTRLSQALTGILTDHGASVVTATRGDLTGATFLVIDQNGQAGYQAGADLVIRLIDPLALPATGVDFLI